jgi:hypothetical protein
VVDHALLDTNQVIPEGFTPIGKAKSQKYDDESQDNVEYHRDQNVQWIHDTDAIQEDWQCKEMEQPCNQDGQENLLDEMLLGQHRLLLSKTACGKILSH